LGSFEKEFFLEYFLNKAGAIIIFKFNFEQ